MEGKPSRALFFSPRSFILRDAPFCRARVESFVSIVYRTPSYLIPALEIRLIFLPMNGWDMVAICLRSSRLWAHGAFASTFTGALSASAANFPSRRNHERPSFDRQKTQNAGLRACGPCPISV